MRTLIRVAFLLLICTSHNYVFAQKVPDGQAARMVDGPRDPSNISQARDLQSTVSCGSCNFLLEESFSVFLQYLHASPDQEWTDGLVLYLPEGVTVLNATNVTGGAQSLPWNGETGPGATITWGDTVGGSMNGPLYVNASLSLELIVDASVGSNFDIDYRVVGDGWGAPPHFSEGVMSFTEGGTFDIALLGIETNYPAGNFAHQNIGLTPYARVQNTGFFPIESYTVSITDGQNYIHELDVEETLAPGAQVLLEMDCWIPELAGSASLSAEAIVASDDNPDNNQASISFTVYPFELTGPPPGTPRSMAEYEPNHGGLVRARQNANGLIQFDIPMSLMETISTDDILYVVCTSAMQSAVQQTLNNGGVNMANVQYVISGSNSPWTRDYGPWFVEYGDAQVGVVNFPYNRARPSDNEVPIATADFLELNYFNLPILHTGGNYMTTGDGVAASDDLTYHENDCHDPEELQAISEEYLGIHTYHLVPDPLNSWLQHIDTWAKFLAPDKVMVLEVPPSDSNHDDLEAMALYFSQQMSGYGYPYKVYRVYTPNDQPYANAVIMNKKVLLPVNPNYGTSCQQGAVQSFQEAMPGYEVVVSQYNQWWSQDALHCRVMQIADDEALRIVHQPYHDTIEWVPALPFSAQVYSLSANGVDREETAMLHYRIDGGDYQIQPLDEDGNFIFSNILDGLTPNTELCYYIAGQNNNNRSQTHPLSGADEPHCVYLQGEPVSAQTVTETVFAMYPNPAAGEVFIRLLDTDLVIESLELYSLDGRKLHAQNWPRGQGHAPVQISLSSLSAGMYLLRLYGSDTDHTLRLVKQ